MKKVICKHYFMKLLCLAFVITASGCATYGQQQQDVRSALTTGKLKTALALVEGEDKSSEDVLASMNKGILRRMTGDYAGSNAILEIAKNQIEELYGVSISEQAGAMIVNDTLRSYSGDRYEQVLLHAIMALNNIDLGDFDAARVEMLQADVKMREWGEQPEEDPFVRYLSGLVYEILGETDEAIVSYRMAKEAYKATQDKNPTGVPGVLKKDLLRLLKSDSRSSEYSSTKKEFAMNSYKPERLRQGQGELVVILNNGLAPVRGEVSIMSFSNEAQQNLKIALPTYPNVPAVLMKGRLVSSGGSATFETIENVDSLARAALNSDLPVITARAIARAVVKATTQKEAGDQDALAGFLMMVVNVVSEVADTRSWTTLPQEIQMSRMTLPAGQQQVRIEMVNAGGQVVDTIAATVNIESGRRTLLARHWAAPVQIETVTKTAASK